MKVAISGIGGHMGQEVFKLASAGYRGAELIGGIDAFADPAAFSVPVTKDFDEFGKLPAGAECEVIVDFSHHSITGQLTDFAVRNGKILVIATTGQTEEEIQMIRDAARKIPVFHAANYSLGIALLIELAKKAAAAMPDAEIEIIEKHHDRKIDAPSGTALAIADAIRTVRPEAEYHLGRSGMAKRTANEIGIHAVRMGNIVGDHEVMIGTQNQTITLKHEAHSRALFAEGALAACEFMIGKPAGLYSMKDLVGA